MKKGNVIKMASDITNVSDDALAVELWRRLENRPKPAKGFGGFVLSVIRTCPLDETLVSCSQFTDEVIAQEIYNRLRVETGGLGKLGGLVITISRCTWTKDLCAKRHGCDGHDKIRGDNHNVENYEDYESASVTRLKADLILSKERGNILEKELSRAVELEKELRDWEALGTVESVRQQLENRVVEIAELEKELHEWRSIDSNPSAVREKFYVWDSRLRDWESLGANIQSVRVQLSNGNFYRSKLIEMRNIAINSAD